MRPLSKDDQEAIFGINGPLSSFSSKINLAYALSIFGPETRENLDKIRELRNACAHSKRNVSFATKEVADLARSMPITSYWTPEGTDADPRRLRKVFIHQCRIFVRALEQGELTLFTEAQRQEFLP